jgi:hypothetical protein
MTPRSFEPVEAPTSSGSSLSRIFAAVAFLLIGTAIGAAGYRYLVPPPEAPQPPPALVEKSPDITLTAFEDSRRLIDKDPAAYLSANAASPQAPEDYFLMGRAFLLTGKYWEAKRSFAEAKNRLSQADPKNAKTMAFEIAMAMSLIETPGAAEAFAKDISAANPVNNGNSNVSVAAQPASPAR